MTSEQKRIHWQQHLQAWSQSQSSQKAYCEKHSLSLATFSYWRKALKKKVVPDKKLIPVVLPKRAIWVKIFLPTGIRLETPADSLADILPLVTRSVQGAVNVAS